MNILIFLIVFPLCIAGLALVLPLGNALRRTIGVITAILLSAVPIYLLVTYLDQGPVYFPIESHLVSSFMLGIGVLIAAFIVYISIKAKQYLTVLLVVVQSVIMITFEFTTGGTMEIEHSLFVDKFSIIMALIVGIIGSAICLYAIGYIPEYHEHHKEVKDRRRYFSFLIYLFLAAMFGIVFSNNLMWLFFFWEITTICSALLIGYRNDKPSIESQFRALKMNLLGGLVFAIGLVYLYSGTHTMELDKLLRLDKSYRSAPRRVHCLRRPCKVGPIAVFVLADRRHGSSDTGVGAAAFKHHGKSRSLYHPEGGAGAGEHGSGKNAHAHRRGYLPGYGIDCHFPEQCQKSARLFNHLQPGIDCGLRRD